MRKRHLEQGGILLNVIMAALALAAIGVVIILATLRNVRIENTHTDGNEQVSIQTQAGSFNIQSHDGDGKWLVDLPKYPGAREKKSGGGAEFEWTSADGAQQKNLTVAGAEMITSDRPSTVFDFYHERFPAWIITREGNGKISLKEPSDGDGGRFIVIHEKSDGTHIGVATIGTPAAN